MKNLWKLASASKINYLIVIRTLPLVSILSYSLLLLLILLDDDNRIVLQPIGDIENCQDDFVNASYIDVSQHYFEAPKIILMLFQ